MSEQLYRWTNQSNGAWVDTESMRQELVADGVLVPVEPDYAAMSDELYRQMSYGLDERDAKSLFWSALGGHR